MAKFLQSSMPCQLILHLFLLSLLCHVYFMLQRKSGVTQYNFNCQIPFPYKTTINENTNKTLKEYIYSLRIDINIVYTNIPC